MTACVTEVLYCNYVHVTKYLQTKMVHTALVCRREETYID